ncbi:MAG: ABC transporter ATP-binding protein [Nocardioidaceae bacterium]
MTDERPDQTAETMIRLEQVSKTYPGSSSAAVETLTLDVRAGEIVVLVGPSGCGKTTTMRMINRLIEPTTGRIILDGRDVTDIDADELRRQIGYVIQQVGLLPHLTVASNVALVPRALGWGKQQIRTRVDELLDLVGLEPGTYRSRYPKQLSGGQQQRVGVARALAADPPVMLMDEPFGAIDPIIRDRLQDEFLLLQAQIHKTVVFVTHDIQEAAKLGDRIAIFSEGGRIAQYDTPARVLAEPADDFVASFIGSGAAVRLLGLEHAGALPLQELDEVRGERHRQGSAAVVRSEQSVYDALDAMLRAHDDVVVVVDGEGQVLGGLPWQTVLKDTGDHRQRTIR